MSDSKGKPKRDNESHWWLYNAMETTRHCHIEAERRLLQYAKLTSHANLYYGCWTAILTLLTLNEQYANLALPAACFAIAVALWAAFAAAEKYELRARDFYESYTELQQLLGKFERIARNQDDNERERKFAKLLGDYGRVLRSTENHAERDYISHSYKQRVRHRDADHKNESVSCLEKWTYRWYAHISYLLLRLLVYILVPLALLNSPSLISFLCSIAGH